MRKVKNLALFWCMLVSFMFGAQAQVNIGTGTQTGESLPIEPYYGFSYSQSIYLASEINASGSITGVKFYTDPNISISSSNDWVVYLGHTTKTAFSSTTDWETGLTEVFNGSISVVGNEVTITFTTPFAYNGTDNLMVAVDENGTGYDDNADEFYSSAVTGDRALYYRNDTTNPDPTGTLPTASGTQQSVPNIQFIGITQSCPDPSALAVNSITTTSASLAWTDNAGASNWVVEYGTTGFTQGAGTTVPTNTNPHALSSLTPATAYEFYVRSVCAPGDSSGWVGPFSFETPCAALTAPWAEPFATATLPACWSQSGDNNWEYGSNVTTPTGFADYGADNAPDHTAGGGGTFIGMDGSDNGNGDVSVLLSPMIDVSGLTDGQLSYWVFYNNTNDAALNKLIVEIYDGANWVQVDSIQQNLGNTWVEFTTALSTLTITGDVQVRFTITGDNSMGGDTFNNDILIDDVSFDEIPACLAVTALSSANITSTAFDLSWTENGGAMAWNIEYGTSGFTPTGTPTITGATNPQNISSLTPNTSYDFYVQADCAGSGTSTWTGPFTVTTPCGTYTPVYNEDFTAYLPACWEEATGALTASTALTGTSSGWTADGFANNGTTGAARMNIYTTNQFEWLVSPSIDLTGGPFRLKYDVALTTYSGTGSTTMDADDSLALIISTDNGATWSNANILASYTSGSEPSNGGDNVIIDLSAYSGTVKFGFYATSTQNLTVDNSIFIDNFIVEPIPACSEVSVLTATNVSGTSLDLGWTQNGSETAWNIEYGTAGFTPTGTPTTSVTSNPTNITNLLPQTSYDFYVQADCAGSGTSVWVGPFTVTTSCAIYTPDYTENFDTYVPNCWEEAQGFLTSSSVLTGTTSSWLSDGFANNGTSGAARVNIYTTSQDEWLISPSIDLTGGPFQLEYDIALTDYASTQATTMDADDSLAVVISTDNGATWSSANILQVYTAGSEPLATGERAYIDLSAYSGVVKFGFYATSTQNLVVDNDMFIDSFKVTNLCLPVNSIDTHVACDTFTWIDGVTYSASNNTAIHTIVGGAASGCDSIITLNLTINNSVTATDVQTACGSFTWIDGITYTASNNTAIDTIQTVAGCDSIVTLDLTILPLATGTDVQSACDSYTWIDGNTYTASNNTATHAIAGGAANGCDSIVTLDLTITNSAMYTDVHTACDTFTWIDGVTYSASNNTATYTFPGGAANGCDSIVTLDLTINAPDVSITTSGVTLTVGEAGATYAWLDCDNNNTPIAGETGQSFTATANGNYAVEVTKNGCTDTSACTAVTTVSIDDITSLENIVIYPNPVKNTVNVDLGNVNNASISLLDMSGKELFNKEKVEDAVYTFEMNQAPGVYFIRVRSNENVKLFKVIKE